MNTSRKRYRFHYLFAGFGFGLLLMVFLPGCTSPTPSGPQKVAVQIFVRDDRTQYLIPNAKVRIRIEAVPNSVTFPMELTDDNGLAVFLIDTELLEELAVIEIEREGYQLNRQQMTLKNAMGMDVSLVPMGATAVPRETPSATPIPPTPQPNETATPLPTATVTSTNTPIPPSPTSTYTPTSLPPAGGVTLTRRDGTETIYILAGPDVINQRLGTLAVNKTSEVIGRTEENEWLKIVSSSGIEGWVADCEVTLSTTDLSSVPIAWNGSVTAKNCGDNDLLPPPPSGGCVTVSMTPTDWPGREFDDVLLSWSNVPMDATQLKLWVEGPTNDGAVAYVIHPTFSDTQTPYEVELFKFEDGDFEPGANYTFVVQPVNSAGEIICTTEGTFVP